jgi:outer membrane protein assembly factor BamB
MNLTDDYGANTPIWGIAASPLVDDKHVYLQVGGEPNACVVAFDRNTGKEKWRSLDGMASYSAPQFIEQGGQRLLLVWTGDWLAALNPDDGVPVWKQEFKRAQMVINVPDAVVDTGTNRIFLSSFYDGSYLYQLDPGKLESELLWGRRGRSEVRTDALHSIISTSVIRGNYVYGIDSYGELRCLDLENGDRVWEDQTLLEKGRWATAFLVQNGELTWIFTEKGELIIARLTPGGFERISSTHIIEPTTFLPRRNTNILWSHPAYANKHIFVRNDRELIAVDLSK